MKSLSLVLLFIVSTAMASESKSPEALNVDSACSAEGATANCGDKKVGTGLLKCIEEYHKSHKDFKVSDSCKQARKQLKEAHKMKHEMNHEMKK